MHATAEFEVSNWDESQALEADGGVEGDARERDDGLRTATSGRGHRRVADGLRRRRHRLFVGLERIVGTVGDRSGSFVLQHTGTFDGAVAKAKLSVVPGSGTGGLAGIEGEGTFEAGLGSDGVRSIELDYRV